MRDKILWTVRPINDVLDRIAQRERDYREKQHRLTTERHDREQHRQIVQRLAEVEPQLTRARSENESLKQSLDQAAEHSRKQSRRMNELEERLSETEKLLNTTKEKLSDSQRRLSDIQERLTVAEQVTAATQQRALQELSISEQLYEELTQHQPSSQTGLTNTYS